MLTIVAVARQVGHSPMLRMQLICMIQCCQLCCSHICHTLARAGAHDASCATGSGTHNVDCNSCKPTLQDKPGAQAIRTSDAPSVEFDNVSFSYQPDAPVLKNVSFKVEGGQTLALVGATGSGKSSLLRLLFRFYDPSTGSIKMDGQAIEDVTQKSLRAAMAVVPQDTVLFNDTILYNLRCACCVS